MTRNEFNTRYAATTQNWDDAATLALLNDRAYELLADVESDDRDLEDKVKSAFDAANNAL